MPNSSNEDAGGDQGRLLRQLRIDPTEREGATGGKSRVSHKVWVTLALGTLSLVAAIGVAIWRWGGQRFEVQLATAIAPRGSQGPSAILQASGYVTARRQATVSAQITGKLKEVLIEEGEHVQAGQVLARVEDSAYRAGVAQAQAQLAAAKAVELQIQVQLAQARRDSQRNADLVDRNLVSRQALETSQTQVAALNAQGQSQHSQWELARATLQSAQVQLDYCTVRAPFSGVIVAKAAQAGEIISPISAGGGFTRTGVGTIVDMDSLEIEVDVNEAYLNRVSPRQPAQAILDAYPDWNITAHVIAIIPTADRNKATVKVRIGLDQKDPRVLPDMGAKVSFLDNTTGKPAAAAPVVGGVLVPSTAVVDKSASGSVVYSVEAERAQAHAVTPGQVYGDLRSVTGISAGLNVVRAPPAGLRDGARVTVAAAADSIR